MELNQHYTDLDHKFREEDSYALLKYHLTFKTLQKHKDAERLSILEVGCGSGLFTELALKKGFSVFSIEPDPVAFKVAQFRNIDNAKRIQNVDIFQFSIREKFDVVILHDVLEHIENDAGAIEKISTFLNQDGILIVSVPAHSFLFGNHDVQLGHYRRYNRKSLRLVLQGYFELREARYLGALGIPAALYYSRFKRISYPQKRQSLALSIFKVSLKIESFINLRFGSSLYAVGYLKIH